MLKKYIDYNLLQKIYRGNEIHFPFLQCTQSIQDIRCQKIILYYSNGSVEVKMNVVQIISNVIKADLVGIWNPMLVHIYMSFSIKK